MKPKGKIILVAPALSKSFWDSPDHTYPVTETKIKKLFNTAENKEFLHYTIPKIRGLLIGKLNAVSLYELLLKIIPFRNHGTTIAVITKA